MILIAMLKSMPSNIAPKIHEIYKDCVITSNFNPILAVMTKNVRGIQSLRANNKVFLKLLKKRKNTSIDALIRIASIPKII